MMLTSSLNLVLICFSSIFSFIYSVTFGVCSHFVIAVDCLYPLDLPQFDDNLQANCMISGNCLDDS